MASKGCVCAASVMVASLIGRVHPSSKGTLSRAGTERGTRRPRNTLADQGTRRPWNIDAAAEVTSNANAATIHGRGFSDLRSS